MKSSGNRKKKKKITDVLSLIEANPMLLGLLGGGLVELIQDMGDSAIIWDKLELGGTTYYVSVSRDRESIAAYLAERLAGEKQITELVQ